jgi:hypothetical protein
MIGEEELDDEEVDEEFDAKRAEELRRWEAEKAAKKALQEKAWKDEYPDEWREWVRRKSLLNPIIEFGAEPFGFRDFLQEVGRQPTRKHFVCRKDKRKPYQKGNLVWVKRKPSKTTSSTYLTYQEVEREFGIKKSALYKLKDRNLVEWSKPPGSSYLFSRASLQQLMKDNGRTPGARATALKVTPILRRARKAASPPSGPGFQFLK